MSAVALRAEGLSKVYSLGRSPQRNATFYDVLAHRLRHPLSSLARPKAEPFHALRDVSFTVNAGEVVGITGRNGAGKSTLLKILSRITAPTAGRAVIRGRLASLLEVGTGFHPELSGRENVFLNGAILGMRRHEILRRFDEIVAFAELERFIDTPVKHYSSGMYVRLAFAVAAHLDTDVLVVDEVLAVGDGAFQERCLARMEDVSRTGRTVLFVSHNLGAVSRLCTRAIVLERGELVFDGGADAAIADYTARLGTQVGLDAREVHGDLAERLKVARLTLNGSSQMFGQVVLPNKAIEIRIEAEALQEIDDLRVTVALRKHGTHLLSMYDLLQPRTAARGRFCSTITVPAFHLSPGDYIVEVGAYSQRDAQWMWAKHAGSFAVAGTWFPEFDTTAAMGEVNLPVWGKREDMPVEAEAPRAQEPS